MKIYLISQVGGMNTDIVPHFFKYYEKLGVDGFFITFHIHENNKNFSNSICSLTKKYNIIDFNVLSGNWYHILKGRWNKKIFEDNFSKFKNEDWILRADQDEFHKYPENNLKSFLKKCNDFKYEYIRGEVVDRLSPNFPKITSECSLWDSFPKKEQIIKNVHKIMAAKKYVEVEHGAFHQLMNEIEPNKYKTNYKKYPEELKYDHFKWDQSIFDRLDERIRIGPPNFNAKRQRQIRKTLVFSTKIFKKLN